MPTDPIYEKTRRFSIGEIKRVLGMAEPTADRLFAKAKIELGPERAAECLELARLAPLTRRWVPTAAIAALIAGTQRLGAEWWVAQHEELSPALAWEAKGKPDTLLKAGHGDIKTEDGGSCLAELARWISDDAADKEWGRPVDWVDMNDPRVDMRVGVPAGAKPGDRVTAAFAPGGRVWVDIVDLNAPAEPTGDKPAHTLPPRLGTRLAERRYHDVAQLRSAWAFAMGTGPIRLPGETVGRNSDPFADKLEAVDSRRLHEWAVAHGANARELAGPWRTKDALWQARLRMGVLYGMPGPWITFDDAVVAIVDGNMKALDAAMNALSD
jgi:hypothetical protein